MISDQTKFVKQFSFVKFILTFKLFFISYYLNNKENNTISLNVFKKINYFIILYLFGIGFDLEAQIVKKNYYDYKKTKINEDYQVNSNGVKNGYYKAYSKEGILIYSYNFINGKENGLCIDYAGERTGIASNLGIAKTCFGKPMLERQFSNGQLLWEKFYDCIEGKQVMVFKKTKNDDHYEYVEFYSSGKLKEKYNTKDNYKYKGEYIKYYENGLIAEKGNYDQGKIGTWVGLKDNGDSVYIARFEFGFESSYKGFYNNGKVAYVSKADNSFESLTRTDYDSTGKRISYKLIKCYPFIYNCSEPIPKSRKEYAASNIKCENLEKNPFSLSESYLANEIIFNELGDTISNKSDLLVQRKEYGYNDDKYMLIDTIELRQSINTRNKSIELTKLRNRNTYKIKTIYETYKNKRRYKSLIDLLVLNYASRYFNYIELKAKEETSYNNQVKEWDESYYFLVNNTSDFENIWGRMQTQYWYKFVDLFKIQDVFADSTIINLQDLFPNETVKYSNGTFANPNGMFKKHNFITVSNFEYYSRLQINADIKNDDFGRPYGPILNVQRIETSALNSTESLLKEEKQIDKLAEKLAFIFLEENNELLKEIKNISDISVLKSKLDLN
jgi:antitoxin component YwqK of YwqJK toxin-antitoxin module